MQKRMYWTVSLLLITMILVGTETPSHAETNQPLEREFVYVLEDRSAGSNRIHGYRVDGASGELTALGDPVETGFAGDDNQNMLVQRLAFHPATRRLFAVNDSGSNILSVYQVNTTTGELTHERSLDLGGESWTCVAVHPSGSPVIVGGAVGSDTGIVGRVASFVIAANGISPAPGSPADAGAAIPYSCRFSQDGHYLYAGGYGRTAIAGFQVDTARGTLTSLAGSPFTAGVNYPDAYATDDEGRLFVADGSGGPGQVTVFTTNGGIPDPVAAGPFATNMHDDSDMILDGLRHPAGYYLVATGLGTIGVYQISGSGAGTILTPVTGSPFRGGGSILAPNRDGTLLFAATLVGGIFSMTVNPNTGNLTRVAAIETDKDAPLRILSGMAYAAAPLSPPTPHGYLYALRSDSGGNKMYGYQVDATTGMLTLLEGFPRATGGKGGAIPSREGLRFDPVYNRLYGVNEGANTLSAFDVDLATGNLTPLPGSPFVLGSGIWSCVTVHPAGSPVIVGGIEQAGQTGRLFSFQVSESGLVAAPGSPLPVGGTTAQSCSFSPDGSYVYVAGPDIGAYQVDSSSGTLTALPESPFFSGAKNPLGLTVDQHDRLFLTESRIVTETSGVSPTRTVTTSLSAHYAFTLQDGKPAAVAGNPYTWKLGTVPAATLMHPDGYHIVANTLSVYAAWPGSSLTISQMNGSGATTSFELISREPGIEQPVPIGPAGLSALATNHTGSMLFTANDLGGFLQSFAFDPIMRTFHGLSRVPQGALGGTAVSISGLAYAPLLPDLALSMHSTSHFHDNADIRYTLQVVNRSPIAATTPMTLTDDLPDGLRFLAAAGPGWGCASDQRQVTCTHPGPLPGGESLPDLTVTVALAADLVAPPVNQARVFLAGELATGNNQATHTPLRTDQAIRFAALPDRFLDEASFAVTATASSGLPVDLRSATPEVCTVAGTLGMLHAAGTCIIVARQPGNWAYAPAPEVAQQFLVVARADLLQQVFLPMIVH